LQKATFSSWIRWLTVGYLQEEGLRFGPAYFFAPLHYWADANRQRFVYNLNHPSDVDAFGDVDGDIERQYGRLMAGSGCSILALLDARHMWRSNFRSFALAHSELVKVDGSVAVFRLHLRR
jgi:hypothetical protein